MGSALSNLDWVALSVSLIVYPLLLLIAGAWTATLARKMYERWRDQLGWVIALRGWAWMPLLWVAGCLASSSLFLYWRNSFPVDQRIQRDLIFGFSITNVFFYHMWSPSLLWGPTYWFMASIYAFCMASTATVVLAIMGWAHAWLPFGLYFFYPVFAWFLTLVTVVFWWHAGEMAMLTKKWRAALRRGAGIPGRGMDALMRTIDTDEPAEYEEIKSRLGQAPRRAYVQQPQRAYAYAY